MAPEGDAGRRLLGRSGDRDGSFTLMLDMKLELVSGQMVSSVVLLLVGLILCSRYCFRKCFTQKNRGTVDHHNNALRKQSIE